MTVAILALQGAFIEHQKKIESLGHNCIELRCKEDLNKPFDRLILPGGESTTQGKLLRELEMFTPIQHMIENGMPVLGTCAGLILLAETIDGESHYLGTLPVTVKRNAYGRQLGSFYTEGVFGDWEDVPIDLYTSTLYCISIKRLHGACNNRGKHSGCSISKPNWYLVSSRA